MRSRPHHSETDPADGALCDYARLEAQMWACGFQTLIATGHSNTIYLTGSIDTERWMRNPQDLAVLLPVVSFPDRSFVVGGLGERPGFPAEVYACDMTLDARLVKAAEEIKARALDRGRIGIDLAYTPASSLHKLRQLLPEAKFVPADGLLAQMRSVKTAVEVERVRRAVSVSEQALRDVVQTVSVHAGMRYADLVTAWAVRVLERGAFPVLALPYDFVSQATRSFGLRSSDMCRYPARVEPGVVTRLDLGACYKGYYGDQKFAVCLGRPSDGALATFEAHLARQQYMRDVIRPGVTKSEVYARCSEEFASAGGEGSLERYDFWVHGVGLDIHEEPRIGSALALNSDLMAEVTFEVNTVVALEASWLVEDLFIVEESGVACLGSGMAQAIIQF